MNALEAYIPQDRRWALARDESLPDRAVGAVLFADVSGFTPLTEAMTRSLGARRGAEELTKQLNAVYDALIVEIEKYGGSVISFAGDAALCWFAETEDGTPRAYLRAAACAFALQKAMEQFTAVPMPDGTITALAIKVAVTYGTVHRFVVGDADIRLLDVIAGSTVTRSATAEHLAQRGEILMDAAAAQALDTQIEIAEWRDAADRAERFAVVGALRAVPPPPPPLVPPPLTQTRIKPWLHAEVYKRISAEGETFLTELRPVVALFARFHGIDFDADADAGEKLNQFISRAQQVLARYDGTLLELTIGDKGSYFYATFGALHMHEDDARRAVFAGRELFPLCRALGFLEPLQVGISQGVMRVGGYGGASRRMYGAQGDEVNLAARLMTEAAPGMLLVSGRIQKTVANEFDLEPLPPIRLKGKAEPLLPFVVQGLRETRVQQLQEAYYSLPMIGREAEMALLQAKLQAARDGKGQIIGITARAGMGKSRLTAEVIRMVRRRRESSYGGECQSFGSNIPYLVWVPIWRTFFGVDANLSRPRQVRALQGALEELAPKRFEALPLLGTLLDIPIPENDFTRALEPEFRRSALHALLRDCLVAAAQEARAVGQILLFVLEDAHWIDPASRALLQELAVGIGELPVVFLLNYRPMESETEHLPQIEALSNFTEIKLDELTDAQGEGLIRAKLAQHAPENVETIPQALIARVTKQAQGNPFYIEQLLDYMHDRGINFRDPAALDQIELPNTMHRLILSRLDQLSERQQLTLKAASIIGRFFRSAHLCGYYPTIGTSEQIRADLALLLKYDLTALAQPDPELAYVFKHVVTHQVAYESLAYATRAMLHERYARFIEAQGNPERALDLLAYHYDRSTNLAKRKEYLQRAGQAAAARFANREAVDYLSRALALTTEGEAEERYALLVARERVFDVQGERERQRADLRALEQLATTLGDPIRQLQVLLQQGWLAERLAEHETASRVIQQVTAGLNAQTFPPEPRAHLEIEVTLLQGVVLWQQGNAAAARPHMEHALALANATQDRDLQARALSFLGLVLRELGEHALAQSYYEQLLEQARANGDKRREYSALNNLGLIANARGDFARVLTNYGEGLRIAREIGDRPGEALLLGNLAIATMEQGEFSQARAHAVQSRRVSEAIGDRRNICRMALTMGEIYRLTGNYAAAQTHNQEALTWALEIHDRLNEDYARMNLAAIALENDEPERARALASDALPLARAIQHRDGEAFLLNTLGQAQLALGELQAAQATFDAALAVWRSLEASAYTLPAHAGLAEIALQQSDAERARRVCGAIFEFLQQYPHRAGEPPALAAQLTCYHVLRACDDTSARAALVRAYEQMQTRADKIGDAELKRSFLENVRANAQLLREAQRIELAD
jgi:adenylate cyclase